MDCSMISLEAGQNLGPHKCARRREQIDRKTLYRAQEEKKEKHSYVKAPSTLPHVAGIVTFLSDSFPYPASLDLHSKPFASTEREKQLNELVILKADVIHQLRQYGLPVTLYGEDDDARLLRFKELLKSGCPLAGPHIDNNRNDLPLDLVDFKRSDKIGFLRRDNKNKKKGVDNIDEGFGACNGGDVGTGEGAEANISDLELDANHENMLTQFDALCDEDKILVFFRQLLKEWQRELQKRPESEKRSDKGRSNAATLEQCAQNLAPLIRMCKTRTLLQYMRQALLCIVTKCLQRDYVGAMDQYVKLALYGAPCPIGITMIDIYECMGRDKIFSNVAAQASADEIAHKFLQSVKRLMTLCQRRYPAALSKPI
ncbi:hypothetical protein L7F22_045120 [Adiantum nelumboides]|nr:hypothetical protein [Adiantum nelumboides]